MNQWIVEVHCIDPIRVRRIEGIEAFSEDQAMILAEKRAVDIFGKKGEGWKRIVVHMPNTT